MTEELNVGSGKKCSSCGGTVAADRKTCQNCGHSFASLGERVEAAEGAVIALASQELGDTAGHDFHGNQYSGGNGSSDRTDEGQRLKSGTAQGGQRAANREPGSSDHDKTVEDLISRGPHSGISGREQWETGVAHGADYLRNGDQIESASDLQEYAREQLEAPEYGDEQDTSDASGRPLSDPEAYFTGLLDFADATLEKNG